MAATTWNIPRRGVRLPHDVRVLHHRARPALVALLLVALTFVLAPSRAAGADEVRASGPRSGDREAAIVPPVPTEGAPRCRGRVALTFDDGPVPGTTRRLIRILKEAEVPATFFVVGRRVHQHPELVREIEEAGFAIGNHSWAHRQMTAQSDGQLRRTLHTTNQALLRAGVRPTRLMRPPYGAINARVRRVVTRAGYVPVLWSVDSRDWAGGSSKQIARRILRGLHRGSNVVLQHDGVSRSAISVAAVAQVIRVARQRGFCFAALDAHGRPGSPAPATGPTPRAEPTRAVATVHRAAPVSVPVPSLATTGPITSWRLRGLGTLPGWFDPRVSVLEAQRPLIRSSAAE